MRIMAEVSVFAKKKKIKKTCFHCTCTINFGIETSGKTASWELKFLIIKIWPEFFHNQFALKRNSILTLSVFGSTPKFLTFCSALEHGHFKSFVFLFVPHKMVKWQDGKSFWSSLLFYKLVDVLITIFLIVIFMFRVMQPIAYPTLSQKTVHRQTTLRYFRPHTAPSHPKLSSTQ